MSSSTRYSQQPLQIYQDPIASFDHAPMPSTRPANFKKASPLRPIKDVGSKQSIRFNPPQNGGAKQSPHKAAQQSSSSPSRAPLSNKFNMISMPPPGGPVYSTDSIEKKQPLMSKFKPQKSMFMPIASAKVDKENCPDSRYQQPQASYANTFSTSTFSLEGLYGQRPQKRTLLEAAPIHESRPIKKPKMDEALEGDELHDFQDIPAPESFPTLVDDGGKPSHSYAQLIGMSILRAPNRRLTLAQIYKWISDTFSFYGAQDAGWQNSIRHNLSLNKAFIKQERPKDDPGKGNYWAIQPGMEYQFIKEKEKATRKSTTSNENPPQLPLTTTSSSQPEIAQYKPLTPALAPQELPPQPTYNPEPHQLAPIPELSSDATIPASDAYNPEPEPEEPEELTPSSPLIQSSPPAAMMHSSPPIPRHVSRRNDTPPPVPRFPSSSRSRSHKRKFASMDDSGYFSSLDSSAMRPHGVGRLLTSEADRPRMKRGRAEEEIARIRGSSYDSPTKARIMSGLAPPSSSPLRRPQKHESTQMLPPLTPIVKLKPPMRPPPTASPNTNLQLHRDRVREMVGSPVRGMTVLDESIPWSPAFNLETLEENAYLFADTEFGIAFDLFADSSAGLLSVPGNGSPEKRSAKRPRLDRSKSANVLADITNNPFSNSLSKSVTSTPMLKFTPSLEPLAYNSSNKGHGSMDSPTKILGIGSPSKVSSPSFSINFDLPADEDFYGAEFLADEITDFGGMDIMQGFQKIGSGGQSSRSTPKTNSRPAFGRSQSTRF
ncbi:Forkhead sep1 [Hyphodiscus hymeniophilus]|uniref:Forkhead sep1 n=1 Tax=Hyphodiscus hymeniophilus TaxID=353542 RepID=A0A9P6VIW0_9HELO|nr:Forkhead sep1 [Hyphodiscus hymeniophilus]